MLLVVQLLTSVVAITLFVRMSPAIRHILDNNVATFEATEQVLLVLTRREEVDAADRRAFLDAVERATRNMTEPEEAAPLETLRRHAPAALDGDREAREHAVAALVELGHINRAAAKRADSAAQRLGAAGAWTSALLGLIGMAISFYAVEMARRRVLAPLAEMADVAHAYQGGDLHRRCSRISTPSEETDRVMTMINRMLDEVEARGIRSGELPRE